MAASEVQERRIKLLGYIKISGEIEVKTGLHIGGTSDSIDKGGIDSPVIKNPVTNEPFIPGSSLRGRMRSWLEKKNGAKLASMTPVIWMEIYPEKNYEVDNKYQSTKDAKGSEVCRVFGDSSCKDAVPSVLIVRDAIYTPATRENRKYIQDNLPVTEAKLEIVVDRITAHALPRTIERVPAGVCFDFELIYKVQTYDNGKFKDKSDDPDIKSTSALLKDINNILDSLDAIEEFEGLGGNTSRGYGKVLFNIKAFSIKRYGDEQTKQSGLSEALSPDTPLIKEHILNKIKESFALRTETVQPFTGREVTVSEK